MYRVDRCQNKSTFAPLKKKKKKKKKKCCDMCMRQLSRGDGRCPHNVLQRHRQGLSLNMYANGNAAKVKSLDRAFLTEDDVNRKKGDIAGHAHVQAWFGSIIRSD